MKTSIHSSFISTPIFELLKESVNVSRCIAKAMETQPLCEYIMQTTFLKMTGASEQKLKCICWEMATYDYDYRYRYLSNKDRGECSSYAEKKSIFDELLLNMKNMDSHYNFDNLFPKNVKKEMCEDIKNIIISNVSGTAIEKWENRSFLLFKKDPFKFTNENLFANKPKSNEAKLPYGFFEKDLKDYYENVVRRHRNRCAHNLKSYQNNLPTLNTLIKQDYDYENYFHMFSVLMLLDNLFMTLYDEYRKLLTNLY